MAREWWQDAVFYQIYPRSFADSNGDGIGDLDGITAHLDYLDESLGIDAIWLSPINPSPLKDWGYDVSDYCDVHPDLGTLGAFDRLIAEAHRRGIRIVLDLVPNHTRISIHGSSSRDPRAPIRNATGTSGSRHARSADQLEEHLRRLGVGVRCGERRMVPAYVLREQPDLNFAIRKSSRRCTT